MQLSNMILFVISLCFLKTTYSIDFQSNRQLGSMIFFLSGQSPNDYANYGCWCSTKDKPYLTPLDEIDQCCQTHQACNIAEKTDGTLYPYKTSFEDGTIECSNNEKTKAHRQCKCDLELAQCLNEHRDVYTTNLLYISNDKCNPGFVLNFDDLNTNVTFRNIPDNYYNFNFTGAHYTAGVDPKDPSRISGYKSAMTSPPNVLFSQNQMTIKRSDGQPFSIVSFSAAAAFIKNLKLNIIGTRQYSPLVFNETFTLRVEARTNIELNWSGMDLLTFTATGGTTSPSSLNKCGDCHFAMDDLRFRL